MNDTRFQANIARVSVKLVAPFAVAARELGVHVELGLAAVGLTLTDLDQSDSRVSHALVNQMLRAVLARADTRDIGLFAAERLRPEHLDILEYVARSQEDLRSGLELWIRFITLLHDGLAIELSHTPEGALFEVSFGELSVLPCMEEFVLAAHVLAVRRMTGVANLAPCETHFTHARPKHTQQHERIFRSRLRFDQTRAALLFGSGQLATPMREPDLGLARILERQASNSLRQLGAAPGLLDRVREIVRAEVCSGELTAATLARRLGMSSRTLHRRLSLENVSYRAVLDDVRREVALRRLRDRELTINEVGYSLGFTTGPAFHRAFRRWTGTTVSSIRTELLK